jgi:hypothetical protein
MTENTERLLNQFSCRSLQTVGAQQRLRALAVVSTPESAWSRV